MVRNLTRWMALASFGLIGLGEAGAQQYLPAQTDYWSWNRQFLFNTPGHDARGMQRTQTPNGYGGYQTFEYNGPMMGNTQSVPQSAFSRNLYPAWNGPNLPGNINRFPGDPFFYKTYNNGNMASSKSSTYNGTPGGGGGGGGATTNGVMLNNQLESSYRPPVGSPLLGMTQLMYQYQPVAAMPVQALMPQPLPRSSPGNVANGPLGLGNGPVLPAGGAGNLAGPMPAFEQDLQPQAQARPQAQSKSRGRTSSKGQSQAKARTKSQVKSAGSSIKAAPASKAQLKP